MEKILVIIKREYLARVRTRAFLIGTIITPVFLVLLGAVPAFLASRGGGERYIAVLDQSGDPGLFDSFEKKIKEGDSKGKDDQEGKSDQEGRSDQQLGIHLTRVVVPPDADWDQLKKAYQEDARKDSDKGYLVLPSRVLDDAQPEYNAKNTSDFFTKEKLERSLSDAITDRRLVRAGFGQSNISQYTKHVSLVTNKVDEKGETHDSGQSFAIGFVMLLFIYMTTLMYGISMMRGVIEEKQSRIVEVVISSVKPFQMMMGKLIGVGAVGLTQYLIWVFSAATLASVGIKAFGGSKLQIPAIPSSMLICFVVYFLLGYFLYATLYAMVGSMCSSEDDSQQLSMPVTMLLVIPMMVFWVVIRDPNGSAAIAMSMIPFFAPTLMMMRIAVISPPLWQVLLSMALMLVTIVAIVWVASKIYRVCILMYGKRPSLADIGRFLRYA
jgi:ABC-2 type transport system permease protein